jgi:hypothetical protein
LAHETYGVQDLPCLDYQTIPHVGEQALIDGEAPAGPGDTSELAKQCSRDHGARGLGRLRDEDVLDFMADTRHGGECLFPDFLLCLAPLSGKAQGHVDDHVRMEEFIEGGEGAKEEVTAMDRPVS